MPQPRQSKETAQTISFVGRRRFAEFTVDLLAGQLHKNGSRVRIQDQPFQILALLTQRAGEVVTREDLRKHLWPAATFVDFDNSLNAAVAKILEALEASPETQKFFETVPGRGSRFKARGKTHGDFVMNPPATCEISDGHRGRWLLFTALLGGI